jgi:phospholipase C
MRLPVVAILLLLLPATTLLRPAATPGAQAPASGIHKIQHIVIVMQENRSFDHYFGTFPGADGIPMRCDGSYTNKKGKASTVHWELRHVQIGVQNASLFEVPADYSKLPAEAAATLFGLRLASHPKH